MSFAATAETLLLAAAEALTSAAIGTVVDTMFPAEIPTDDLALVGHVAAQFGVSTAIATEAFRVVLSMRPDDSPPPLSDGIPFFFLYTAQPNLLNKLKILAARQRARFTGAAGGSVDYNPADVSNTAAEGGNPANVENIGA